MKIDKLKRKHSFATEYDPSTGENVVCIEDIAKVIKQLGWGNFPKHINDTRAFEIVCLAKSYLKLTAKLRGEK